jgi:D-glycero-D-manno-heptose 1,7-bisphosphate phosphatase
VGRLKRSAAFLDRDGTLNVQPAEHEYVASAQEFVWLPGAADGVARLARAGYLIAVVSNQRGVSRGLVTPEALRAIERKIQLDLASLGCDVDAFRYCFHTDEDACECRKPGPGMLTGLAEELEIDLRRSWMIGDSGSDILAGKAAGCRTVLIGRQQGHAAPDFVAASLLEASELIADRDQPAVGSTAASNSLTSA